MEQTHRCCLALERVLRLCLHLLRHIMQVIAGIFVVNSGPIKYALVHRIIGFKAALLKHVSDRQFKANQETIACFEQQQAKVLRQAQTTEECLQLSKDIVSAEEQLEQLKDVIHFSRSVDFFLEKYWCDLLLARIFRQSPVWQ